MVKGMVHAEPQAPGENSENCKCTTNKILELQISTRELDRKQRKLMKKISDRGLDSLNKLSSKDQ